MNIIEALKSGKRFRRGKNEPFIHIPIEATADHDLFLSRDDVLANDWEIEEPSARLTKSDVLRFYELGMYHAHVPNTAYSLDRDKQELHDLLRKMGLE